MYFECVISLPISALLELPLPTLSCHDSCSLFPGAPVPYPYRALNATILKHNQWTHILKFQLTCIILYSFIPFTWSAQTVIFIFPLLMFYTLIQLPTFKKLYLDSRCLICKVWSYPINTATPWLRSNFHDDLVTVMTGSTVIVHTAIL